ncbi:MAG: hypothetical protein EB141_09040 [Verrucomicrobia bacterium]|nr:hypothetical protein [Verrucomicrobiota bacterium]NBU07662.1 hypothetical protein [Pseudomonadota bacterium]NDA65250.1 hypothetical protein [Verrucomicrobiota bacterium]NDB75773.1 hypothetical protein [Verrucomicrobiota bacterium]NDD36992.1 hypothetical protein [Verrucomicrobiota bacterium]
MRPKSLIGRSASREPGKPLLHLIESQATKGDGIRDFDDGPQIGSTLPTMPPKSLAASSFSNGMFKASAVALAVSDLPVLRVPAIRRLCGSGQPRSYLRNRGGQFRNPRP